MDRQLQTRYERLKSLVAQRRDAFNALMDYLESETDWLHAPACWSIR